MTAASALIEPATPPGARSEREARRESAAFGMWVFLASEAMFFGGLLFAYAYGRLRFPAGFAAASQATDVLIGTINTAILLSSSLLVALALAAAATHRRRYVSPLLAATALLGGVFLALKGFEYHADWARGFFPGAGFRLRAGDATAVPAGAELFCMLYFSMTGVHALHMAIGVAWMGWLSCGVRYRPPRWMSAARLEVAGLYWHFVDVIWIVLYPLLYLVSRHA